MDDIHEIIDVEWLEGYTIQVTFSNLKKAVIDLKRYLGRGIFKELISIEKFKRFRVDSELGTIVWPNGADIAPEVLYRECFSTKRSDISRAMLLAKEPVKRYGRKK